MLRPLEEAMGDHLLDRDRVGRAEYRMGKILLSVLAALLLAPVRGAVAETATITRSHEPVIVSGEPLARFYGRRLASLRLYAMREGVLTVIPYQIDKRDADGNYLIPTGSITREIRDEVDLDDRPEQEKRLDRIDEFERNRSRYERAVEKGEMSAAEFEERKRVAYFTEDPDALDYNDELVFMLWDAGRRVEKARLPGADAVELTLENPLDGTRAWAYLVRFEVSPPSPSEKGYLTYDPGRDRVVSVSGVMDFIDDNPLILEALAGKQPDGSFTPNILDRFKLRIKIKPRPLFCLSLNFDENNIRAYTVGYKAGPVRVIRRNVFWITIGGIKLPFVPKAMVYYLFYPNALVGPAEVYNPFDPALMLCDGSHFVGGVDLRRQAFGTDLYTRDNPKGIHIDGVFSPTEQELAREDQSWIGAYNERDRFGFIARVAFDEELERQGASLDLVLIDDSEASQPPETEEGVHFVGYEMDLKKFPQGKYHVCFMQYLGSGIDRGEERQFLLIMDHPLVVTGSAPEGVSATEAAREPGD